MSATERALRMADRLPVAMAEGASVRSLMGALAVELEAADQGIFRLARSRHLHLSDNWWGTSPPEGTDLGRLGELIGLPPLSGERSGDYRNRILGLLSVHRAGLGTAEAVLRLAAMALRLEGRVETAVRAHSDGHFTVATGQVRVRGLLQTISLEVIDNPPTRCELRRPASGSADPIRVHSHSVAPCPLEVRLRAETTMVAPLLRCGRIAVLFAGVVPAQSVLQLQPRGARINGRMVQAPLLAFQADMLDGGHPAPRFALPMPLAEALLLPPGESQWSFSLISPGAARALALEVGVPCDLQGEDEVCDAQPSVELCWEDQAAASFALRYPDVLPDWARDRSEVVAALRAAVSYGRAAGIEGHLQLHISLRDEGVVPEDRAPPRMLFHVQEDAAPQDRLELSGGFSFRDRIRINDQAREVGYTKFARQRQGLDPDGFPLDTSMLVEARDAMFDRSTTDGVWLDHDAFDDAQPSVFGHAHFDQEALAREGTVPDPDLVLDPEDPRLPLPRLRLWWDEQPHPDAGLLDRDALALEQVARFEEEGLHLDHVALAFDLQLGVFGHGRLGQAGEEDG
ncbi:MAG TPA: hypothetical protein PKW90_15535, partial [Myxococcota bacterium]|nr:hypothetical protein [Myxococcota bacterium]